MAATGGPPFRLGPTLQAPPPASRQWGVSKKACTHALKLRTNHKINAHTSLEIGADLGLHGTGDSCSGAGSPTSVASSSSQWPFWELSSAAPWASLVFQMDARDSHEGMLKLDPHHATVLRRLRLGPAGVWWEVPLDLHLGWRFPSSGHPGHLCYGVSTPKWPVQLALAAAMLAAGKPVHLHREVGGLNLRFPLHAHDTKHSLQERLEFDACLQRAGRGLHLDVRQTNAVVRVREA